MSDILINSEVPTEKLEQIMVRGASAMIELSRRKGNAPIEVNIRDEKTGELLGMVACLTEKDHILTYEHAFPCGREEAARQL